MGCLFSFTLASLYILIAHAYLGTDTEVGEFLRVYGEGDSKTSWQVMVNLNRVSLDNLQVGTEV